MIEEYERIKSERKLYRDNQTRSYDSIDYSQMLKNQQIFAESLETSSLEGESYRKKCHPQKTTQNQLKNTIQNIDNEIDERIEISSEIDDIRRGLSMVKY